MINIPLSTNQLLQQEIDRLKTLNTRLKYIFVISLCILTLVNVLVLKTQPVKTETVTNVKYVDSTWIKDSTVLTQLIPRLMKREGLMLKPYNSNGKSYVFYGHLILNGEKYDSTNLDSAHAKYTLWNDIHKSYIEYKRLMKKSVYNIFISGHQ